MRSGRWSSSPILARLAVAGLAVLVLSFSGCGSGSGGGSGMVHGVALQGVVHGGQQGVKVSTIQLYQVGATGYGSEALVNPILASTTTDNHGFFSITGSYTCPTPTTQVYIVSSAGDPGVGSSNGALMMMAGLGNCGDLTSSTFIFIDEVTTAASVYALAPFMTGGPANIGSSATNSQGIANAFTTIKSLVNTTKGTAPGTLPAGATAPINEINTLADIIAPCVNSSGSDGTCAGLFSAVHTIGGVAPTNTLDAMLSIAQNPGYDVSGVYGEATGTPPFMPVLSGVPHDWTLPITYSGGGLNNPFFMAIDGAGGIWITNNGNGTVSKFDNFGNALSPSGGFTGGGLSNARGIAIDALGNAWISDYNNPGAMSELDSSGTPVTGSPFSGGGLQNPTSVAIDGTGNIWSVSYFTNGITTNNDLNKFSSSGSPLSGTTGFTGASLNNSVSFAIVPTTGVVWAANEGGSSLSEFTNTGTPVTNIPFSDSNGLSSPQAIAIDASGNLWVADASGDISKLDSSGNGLAVTFMGVTPTAPYSILVDGTGNVWMPDAGSSAVFEVSPSDTLVSPTGSYTAGGTLAGPLGSGIDSSGNLWLPNSGANTLTKIVGVAAPVTTPLTTAVAGSKLGVRP
jgi:streptogramin lyase